MNDGHNDDRPPNDAPLDSLAVWEDDVRVRYPEDNSAEKPATEYRNFAKPRRSSVGEFYRLNHAQQTFAFARSKREQFSALNRQRMGIWQALEFLDTLVDDSDPDTELSQIQHLMQTAEAIRADNHPRWFVLTGLVHDLGKILCLWGEPQWAVVGDTFPVGCKFSGKIVYSDLFAANVDFNTPRFQSELGIYQSNAGLKNVTMSWGHDEYMYWVAKDYLPEEALYMIRYHSFYAEHKEQGYTHLLSDHDQSMFSWVRRFSTYDLYSKSPEPPNVAGLKPFYLELIDEFFPAEIDW